MIVIHKLKVFVLVLLFSISFICQAQLSVPALAGHVIDHTFTLNTQQQTKLEHTLQRFEQQTGAQMVVLLIPTTAPESIEQYALRVAEQWQLGRKGVDDGILLVAAKSDHKLRIEVGYGLEGFLPDIVCKEIIDQIIAPQFKQQHFYEGIHDAVTVIMMMAQKGSVEYVPSPSLFQKALNNPYALGSLICVLVAIVIAATFVSTIFFRRMIQDKLGINAYIAFFLTLIVISAIFYFLGFIAVMLFLIVGNIYYYRKDLHFSNWYQLGTGDSGGGISGGGGFSGSGGGFGGGGSSGSW